MNLSWLDNSNKYNTKLNLPLQWNDLEIMLKDDLVIVEDFLKKELEVFGEHLEIFPRKENLFETFKYISHSKVKVVILGQDPYIRKNQAMGLSFSVPKGEKLPPSLKNIYKKIFDSVPKSGDLTSWVEQGVLLLNTSLTVREGASNSHSHIWKTITDKMIAYLSMNCEKIIFILWGRNAYSKKILIDDNKHHILCSSHPSPLSCNRKMMEFPSFKESNVFEKCNHILHYDWNIDPINWLSVDN
jgi:uracil-DNA glycosylase